MHREIFETKSALTEAKTPVTVEEASLKLLNTSLANYNADVSSLTTACGASKTSVTELERENTKASKNLKTPRNVAQETSTAIFDLEGKMTNLTLQVDVLVLTAVPSARYRVDRIQKSTSRRHKRT